MFLRYTQINLCWAEQSWVVWVKISLCTLSSDVLRKSKAKQTNENLCITDFPLDNQNENINNRVRQRKLCKQIHSHFYCDRCQRITLTAHFTIIYWNLNFSAENTTISHWWYKSCSVFHTISNLLKLFTIWIFPSNRFVFQLCALQIYDKYVLLSNKQKRENEEARKKEELLAKCVEWSSIYNSDKFEWDAAVLLRINDYINVANKIPSKHG